MINPELDKQLIMPLETEDDALVENIYPRPGSEVIPDLRSQDIMGEYLISRFIPEDEPTFRVILKQSGRTRPGIVKIPHGNKEVTRIRKVIPESWWISPKQALAVMLGSAALFNAIGNHETITQGSKAAGHEIYRFFNPVQDQVVSSQHEVTVPGKITKIGVNASVSNTVGNAEVDPRALAAFYNRIKRVRQLGGRVLAVNIIGSSSDEWSTDASISVKDIENAQLGKERAAAAIKALQAKRIGIDQDKIHVRQHEHVLTVQQKDSVEQLAKSEGFDSIKSAISAVDSGAVVSPRLKRTIEKYFSGNHNRGVSIVATVTTPGKATVKNETITSVEPGKDNVPEVPAPDWYWFLPMIPIRRRERYKKLVPQYRRAYTSTKPIMRPAILRQDTEQAWIRVRPEALQENGQLVDTAWSYTRKYEHLFRDDRVKEVLRADFSNSAEENRSIRIMFVDHEPEPVAVEAFESLLTKFAAMEDGKIASRVSGIFVYPSENAGLEHGDAKRIAMGIDKQSPGGIMGTYTYALDLVELHMPTTWTAEQLLEYFESFEGTKWTAAHEIAGHGTDENDTPLKLKPIKTRSIANAHIIDGDPRAAKMKPLRKLLRRLPLKKQPEEQILYDISYPVTDNKGQTVTMRARVDQNDPRLAHATSSTIVDHRPTQYAGTNDAEHYAETAAAITTGIPIPYAEAHTEVEQLTTDDGKPANFAIGYRPDIRGQKLFTQSVNAIESEFPVRFSKPPEVSISKVKPEDDPFLLAILNRTRSVRTLLPNEMVAILARVSRKNRKL